jgi:hypothetical protein
MKYQGTLRSAAFAGLFTFALLAGCKSAEDNALDQAKAQAASTNTAQQVQYIDKKGDTVTTTVQPPLAGQSQQISTVMAPAPPGPKPHSTKPIVGPVGGGLPVTSTPATGTVALGDSSANELPPPPGSNSAMTAAPAQPNAPMPPMNVTVPAGTELAIRVNQHISVKHSVAGEHFTGEVVEPVVREGAVVIPRGTPVVGRIDESHRRGHFKGHSILELRLTSMTLNGNQYALDTHDTVRTKKGKGKRTAGWIGGMTGAGMLIGGIASGGVGLAIGAASGAGAGTLIAGTTGNRDIDIPAESVVHFRLSDQLVVQN